MACAVEQQGGGSALAAGRAQVLDAPVPSGPGTGGHHGADEAVGLEGAAHLAQVGLAALLHGVDGLVGAVDGQAHHEALGLRATGHQLHGPRALRPGAVARLCHHGAARGLEGLVVAQQLFVAGGRLHVDHRQVGVALPEGVDAVGGVPVGAQ